MDASARVPFFTFYISFHAFEFLHAARLTDMKAAKARSRKRNKTGGGILFFYPLSKNALFNTVYSHRLGIR